MEEAREIPTQIHRTVYTKYTRRTYCCYYDHHYSTTIHDVNDMDNTLLSMMMVLPVSTVYFRSSFPNAFGA